MHRLLKMGTPRFFKRGLLSVTVLAIAVVAFRFQQPLRDPTISGSSSQTYCYKGVRTHDNGKASAECFSVQDGLFGKVGSKSDVAASTDVETVDGYVIPGLWDGHGHLMQYGEFLNSVDLFGAESLEVVRDRLAGYIKANPGVGTKENWIRGVGWDQTFFGRMPTAVSLILSHAHLHITHITTRPTSSRTSTSGAPT